MCGFLLFLGDNPIHWSTKKQTTVSRSSTEAEFRALAQTTTELTWLQLLLQILQLSPSHTPTLWCDNVSTLALASNPMFHARTKHIEIDFHFIREKVATKSLLVQYISTKDQLADIFTKGLSSPRFLLLRNKLLVGPPPSV